MLCATVYLSVYHDKKGGERHIGREANKLPSWEFEYEYAGLPIMVAGKCVAQSSLFSFLSQFPFPIFPACLHRAPALSPAVFSCRTRNGPPPLCRHKPGRPLLLPSHPASRPPCAPFLGQHPHPSKLRQHSRTHHRPQRCRRSPTRSSFHKG